VRLPGATFGGKGTGVSSRRCRAGCALSAERMTDGLAADLSKLDLLIIQIDGMHMDTT